MKTIDGYSKEKYTNDYALLAGGGTKALSDFGYVHHYIGTTETQSSAAAQALAGITSIDELLNFDTTNSRIGIGTTSPSAKFHVYGNTSIFGGNGVQYPIQITRAYNDSLNFRIGSAAADSLDMRISNGGSGGGSEAIIDLIHGGGGVSISPSLSVGGSLMVSGTTTIKGDAALYHYNSAGNTLYMYIGHDSHGYNHFYNGTSGQYIRLTDTGGCDINAPTTISGTGGDVLTVKRTGAQTFTWIRFYKDSTNIGYLGIGTSNDEGNQPYFHNATSYYKMWHAGNFTPGNYVLKAGDTMTGNLSINTSSEPAVKFYISDSLIGQVYATSNGVRLYSAGTGYPALAVESNTDHPIFRYNYHDYTVYHSGNFTPSNYLEKSGGTMDATAYISWNSSSGTGTDGWATTSAGLRILNAAGRNDTGGPHAYAVALHVSGVYWYQLAFSRGDNKLHYRGGNTDTTWGWHTLIDSDNIGSQSVNYAASAGSASYADSAGSASYADSAGSASSATNATYASYVKDIGNSTAISLKYSSGGYTSAPTYLAAWNDYQITYVSASDYVNVKSANQVKVVRNDQSASRYLTFVDTDSTTSTNRILYNASNLYYNPSNGLNYSYNYTSGNGTTSYSRAVSVGQLTMPAINVTYINGLTTNSCIFYIGRVVHTDNSSTLTVYQQDNLVALQWSRTGSGKYVITVKNYSPYTLYFFPVVTVANSGTATGGNQTEIGWAHLHTDSPSNGFDWAPGNGGTAKFTIISGYLHTQGSWQTSDFLKITDAGASVTVNWSCVFFGCKSRA